MGPRAFNKNFQMFLGPSVFTCWRGVGGVCVCVGGDALIGANGVKNKCPNDARLYIIPFDLMFSTVISLFPETSEVTPLRCLLLSLSDRTSSFFVATLHDRAALLVKSMLLCNIDLHKLVNVITAYLTAQETVRPVF